MALELTYEGQENFWASLNLTVFEDEVTGERLYEEDWSFSHSLEVSFQGEDDDGYLKGYFTDNPQMMDQIFLDLSLGKFKLQWDKFEKAFFIPTWFNPEQTFYGLRFSYTDEIDRVDLIGLKAKNYFREEDLVLNPGDESVGISLKHYPVVMDSVRIWLNGEELQYGVDYYFDYLSGVIFLQFPIFKTSHLHIQYLEEGEKYRVLGGRYNRHLNEKLISGIVFLKTQGKEMNQNLLGSEWLYKPSPWWLIELDTGLIYKEGVPLNLNWRLAHQFNWPNLNFTVDYQVIKDNFQSLLYKGFEGKSLNLSGQYQSEKTVIRHHKNYNWSLNDQLIEQNSELEFIWIDSQWIPYLYYFQHKEGELITEHGIAELGYQTDLVHKDGSLIYLLGIDVKTSFEKEKSFEPYFGIKYQRDPDRSIGARIYGKEGIRFNQLVISGCWMQDSLNWKGELNYNSEYYRMEHELAWTGLPVDITLNLLANRYITGVNGEQNDFNLDLNLDFTAWAELETRLRLGLYKEEKDGVNTVIYQLGGERAINPRLVGYGEIDLAGAERSYTGGVRGTNKAMDYDVNYTYSETLLDGERMQRNKVGFSVGTMDLFTLSLELEVDNQRHWWSGLDLNYSILPNVDLGVHYTGEKLFLNNHHITLQTVYHF